MFRKFILTATALAGVALVGPPQQAEASILSDVNGWRVQHINAARLGPAVPVGARGDDGAVSFQVEATEAGRRASLRMTSMRVQDLQVQAGTAHIDVGGVGIALPFERQSSHAVHLLFAMSKPSWK